MDLMQIAFLIAYIKKHGISGGGGGDASNKVDKNQGIENANKILGTDENGDVILLDVEQMVDMPIDTAPLEGSTNPVSSNGVFEAIRDWFTQETKYLLIEILRDIASGNDLTDSINQLAWKLGVAYRYTKDGDSLYIEIVPPEKFDVSSGILSIE